MTPLEVVEGHLAAYNDRDLRTVVRGFADDAVYASPDGPVVGRRALFSIFREAFEGPSRVRLELRRAVVQGETVACELVGRAELERREVEIPLAAFFTVREGLLAAVRVYRDGS